MLGQLVDMWSYWEKPAALLRLESQEVVRVDPGDKVYLCFDRETRQVVNFTRIEKRVLQ